MREAAMLAAEKYEYTHIRPMFIRERAQEIAMFGGKNIDPSCTASGSNL